MFWRLFLPLALVCVFSVPAVGAADLQQEFQAADAAGRAQLINAIGRKAEASESEVSLLVSALGDTNANVRRRSALAIASVAPKGAKVTESLIKAMGDEAAPVRAAAALALGKVANDSVAAAKVLAEHVTDSDANVRRASVVTLTGMNVDRSLVRPVLINSLKTGDPAVVPLALSTFASLGEAVIEPLNKALADDEAAYWACLVIQEMGPTAADTVPAVTKVLQSEEPEERLQALLALAAIGEKAKSAGPAIGKVLANDDFEGARFAAAYALGKIGAKGVADDQLAAAAKSDSPILKLISAWALAELNPGNDDLAMSAGRAILSGLKSDDATVRRIAANALVESQLPSEITMPLAAELLRTASPETIDQVVDAIAAQGKPALPRVIRALGNDNLRLPALKVIQRMGPDAAEAIEAVTPLLASDDEAVRREALFALASIGEAAASSADKLLEAYKAETVRENRLAAIFAAGRIGSAASGFVPHLKKLSGIPDDEQARVAALWALTRIAADDEEVISQAVPAMIEALSKADRTVIKIELIHGLGDLGSAATSAAAVIESMLDDSDVRVRNAAAEALGNIKK